MSAALITTIIPTRRRPALLRRAIRSVLNQSYADFRLCIYDNASGDDTASVVAEFANIDPRVEYHSHPEDIGALRNFNYGMQHVATPLFSILSDDDVLLPNFYETALAGFRRFPDAIFSAGICFITENGKILSAYPSRVKGDGYYSPPDGLFEMIENNLTWTSILFRREVVEKVGVLDAEVTGLIDLDYLVRVAARFPFVVQKQPCALFVSHENSYVASAHLKLVWPGWLKIIANVTEDKRIPPEVRIRAEQALIKRLQPWLFGIGLRAAKHRQFDDAYKAARILNDYQEWAKAVAVYTVAKSRERFPLAYYLLSLLNKARVYLRSKFRKSSAQEFEDQFAYYSQLVQ
jgi:glycosyltransferase involved in cell wall biosynthesis